MYFEGMGALGRATQNAGTAITHIVPGKRGKYSYVIDMSYTDAGTQHTLTMMRSQGRTKLAAAMAAAATAVTVAADPGPTGNAAANNDYVAILLDDGVTWHLSLITVLTTTTWTLSTALPSTNGANLNAPVAFFGVPGDSYHDNYKLKSLASSSIKNFPPVANNSCLVRSKFTQDPIVIYSDNLSNAGVIERVGFGYSRQR